MEADPNYAAAYAWRVCSASDLPEFQFAESEPDMRRALELDPCEPDQRIAAVFELLNDNFEQPASFAQRPCS
jgi:hypothetical protein